MNRRGLLMLTALVLVASSCSSAGADSARSRIVVTTTILGDVVEAIVGEAASVEVLLPIGTDPHEFQASSRQSALLQSADLVIVNGLRLEEGLTELISSVEDQGIPVLRVAEQLDPLPFGSGGQGSDLDPHVWMDPTRMARAATIIAEALDSLGIEGPWRVNAAGYADQLDSLDAEIRNVLGGISSRVLVTDHDSLGYFAARYDLEVVGVVIPGGSTLASPSSADLAALVQIIRERAVPAVFTETTEPAALAEAVATEAGGDIEVVELFVGSLGGPGSGAETYLEMMLTDARRIAEALA